jgi:hypothetical protein
MRLPRWLPLTVLLVLTLALTPTVARAENAEGKVYIPTVPSIKSEPELPATDPGRPENPNTSHPSKPGTDTRPSTVQPTTEETPGATTAPENDRRQNKKQPGGDPPHHVPQDEGTPRPVKNVSPAEERPSPAEAEAPAKKSGGGSSPVVPLLIAVTVLAVISIGIARHRLNR